MQANIIEYELLDRIAGEEGFIWQYDRGQKLKFKNVELPFSYEVHFANKSSGPSLKVLGDSSGVVIPYDVTKTGKPVYLWLYIATSESAAQTVYGNTVPVRLRAEVATETPTPEQQGVIEQVISALNEGVAEAREIAEGIPEAIDAALEQAKASGEFKGDPGAVFTPAINDGVMTWSNDGDIPNPDPVDLKDMFDLDSYATKQELDGKVDSGLIGSANGVAGLDASGRVPSEQLPSYVDDVLEFASVSQFPTPGESGKIYVSLSNNHQYRWTGSQYIDITGGDLESKKADKRDTVLETTLSRGRRSGTEVGVASIAFGNDVTASGYCSVATGNGTVASGEYANAEGYVTIASGGNSHAEGYSTHATGLRAHAEGRYTWAIGDNSHAEGDYTQVEGTYAHGEGSNTHADGDASHSEGSYTHANGDASHAEGKSTTTYSEAAHAEGSYTVASSESSHAEGVGGTFTIGSIDYQSGSYGQAAHSEGYRTRSQGDGAHSEGEYTVANAPGAHAEGVSTRALGYNGAHAEGSNTLAADDYTHAEGHSTIAENDAAHAEGSSTHASGASSHAEGNNTTATGTASHAEGTYTTASNQSTHAEGSSTQATASYAHSEGLGTTASGEASHAEGAGTQATGLDSHAEGAGSRAVGAISHAEGGGTNAAGLTSHAEGSGTQAIGAYSHSEGGGTNAIGANSHAEGGGTRAAGTNSHAEGGATVASGACSHAEGLYTIAAGACGHVFGSYNVEDSYDNWTEWTQGEHCVPGDKRKRTRLVDEQTVVEGYICKVENTDSEWVSTHWYAQEGKMNYAEIVGNGTGNSARSNAYCLDWDGNGHFAGDVYIGCNPDGTGGVKLEVTTFATDAEIQNIIDDYGVSA